MGRTSTKENKNSYQLAREELGLTREKASELLETIAPERIEKIENERTGPRPDEVLTMAEKYKRPSLCNCYCSQQCPIGQRYVPFVTRRELPSTRLLPRRWPGCPRARAVCCIWAASAVWSAAWSLPQGPPRARSTPPTR